jgi:hypothetical protein
MPLHRRDVQKMDVHFLDIVSRLLTRRRGATTIRLSRWKLRLPFVGRWHGEELEIKLREDNDAGR